MSKTVLHLVVFFSFVTLVFGQPELDISFNSTGRVTTEFGSGGAVANEILIQPDQKIIAVGSASPGFGFRFGLTRYNTDGSLDATFGENGRVFMVFDPNSTNQGASAAALQPDGKIIAAGSVLIGSPGPAYFAVARYNPDGSLDQTFGNGGKTSTFIVQHMHTLRGMALAPDGKIVVAGDYFVEASGTRQSLIVRFNPDGSLDSSFGIGGKVTDIRGSTPGDSNIASSVAVQPDGKIVTGGSYSRSQFWDGEVTMVRYNVDGTYDTSFASGGRLLIPSPNISEGIEAIALQPDGRIVGVGSSGEHFLVVRFNPDGTPDPSFDTDGRVTTPIYSSAQANSVVIRPSGKIFVSGKSLYSAQLAAYYNADGSLDKSFSGDGKFVGSSGSVFCAAFDDLGRVVLGGSAPGAVFTGFGLTRLYTLEPELTTVSGRAITKDGQPIRGVTVGLSSQPGEVRWAITSTFGYYQFDDVPTGRTYELFVRGSKRHTFETRVFGLNEAIDNLDLIGASVVSRSVNERPAWSK